MRDWLRGKSSCPPAFRRRNFKIDTVFRTKFYSSENPNKRERKLEAKIATKFNFLPDTWK